MGQSLRVHREVTLDSRHLLARVIALAIGGVRVLDALGVHDTEAGLLFPSIALSGRANRFFLGLAPEWNPDLGQAAHSIAGNTGSRCANRGSPRAAFATGSRFSGGTVRRRKRHTSPRCGAWSGGGPTPTSAGTVKLLPADVAGIGMRHDYPSPDNSLNLTYSGDRRQVLRVRRGIIQKGKQALRTSLATNDGPRILTVDTTDSLIHESILV